tara:strand:- start:2166 stop:2702 length:537 start_codon:yes stop_codon:yes gene_type:complete
MVQTKKERKEYMKQYNIDNREKRREKRREYYLRNKAREAETAKLYHEKNKEQLNAYNKQYYNDNRGILNKKSREYQANNKEQAREYKKNNPDKAKISSWKYQGVIHHDYNALYDRYINTHICDVCAYPFDKTNWRCIDHDHSTGLFRQVICHNCNNRDYWIKVLKYQNYQNCLKYLNL